MSAARAEQHRGRHHEDREVGAVLLDRRLAVERWPPRERPHRPDREQDEHAAEQPRRVPHDDRARSAAGRNAEATAGITASVRPTGVAEHEAGVRHVDEHGRRAERVQPEEPGGDEERHRDEEEPRVFVAARFERGLDRERGADHRGDEHEPEVRRLVLPHEVVVDLRILDEQPEPEQRQRDVHEPHERARGDRPSRHGEPPKHTDAVRLGRGMRFVRADRPVGRSVLEERDVEAAEDPVDRRALGDDLQPGRDESRASCSRSSASSIARTRPTRSASSSVSSRPRHLRAEVAAAVRARGSAPRDRCRSSHAAPLIADSAMRCSVPSMPSPCGNGSAGASHGATYSRVPKSRAPARNSAAIKHDRRARSIARRDGERVDVCAAPDATPGATRQRPRRAAPNNAAMRNDGAERARRACRGSTRRRRRARRGDSRRRPHRARRTARSGREPRRAARRRRGRAGRARGRPWSAARCRRRGSPRSSRASPRRSAVSSWDASTGAITARASTKPACRAAIETVAARTLASVGGTDGRAEDAAEQAETEAAREERRRGPAGRSRRGGRRGRRGRRRARRRPRPRRAVRGSSGRRACARAIAPSGRPLTTSAPVIGDQPHTTTSSSTARNNAPTSAPYSSRKPDVREPRAAHPFAARARSRRPALAVEHRDQRDRGERRLQQEDAAPAEELGEEAAERGPDRGADRPRQRPTSRSRARRCRGCRRAPARRRPARARRRNPAARGRRSAPRTSWRSRTRATRPRTRRRPMPANTWPRTRRSSGSTASAPTTIARLYAVIVHETPTIDTSNVP